MGLTLLKTKFSNLSSDVDLRIDSKFYKHVNKDDFKIIEKSKYKFIELRNILIPDYQEVNYEKNKKFKGVETSKDYFDDFGKIKDFLEISEENHPKRLKYLAKKNQLIISSLKGAKAPTLLITEKYNGYVLSNGFYIFILKNNNEISRNFWYYVLSSNLVRKILDENLSRGIGISSYKDRDLLLLKVPDVPENKQEEALQQIIKIKEEINELFKKIPNMQKLIDETFNKELGFIESGLYIKKESTSFQTKFYEIGNRKHLRCSAKYNYFWKFYKGFLFKKPNCEEYVTLRNYITTKKNKVIKKGYLKEKRILIDKEEVEAKTGIIKDEPIVEKIESDKIEFGNCDLLVSKIDPFLGNVIINKKEKRYIGTPEFIPLFVNKNKFNIKFVQYLFLSNNFLELSKKLMAGKRQPRINRYELLSLQIPYIDIDIQDKLIEDLKKEWGDVAENKKKINKLKIHMEKTIINALAG